MLSIVKDASFDQVQIPMGILEVRMPPRQDWQPGRLRREEVRRTGLLRAGAGSYDRQEAFGENPYYRYYKRYKKTYPVLQQLESFLLKGRPFPQDDPLQEIAFLVELETRALVGMHDGDRVEGQVVLYRAPGREDFLARGNRPAHTYPEDVTARDDRGVILSMIAGPDSRTALHPDTVHPVYLVFGTPGMEAAYVQGILDRLSALVGLLAPGAEQLPRLL